MNILAAIRQQERQIEKQVSELQHRLDDIRAAAKALGYSGNHAASVMKKRVLSAAGRTPIAAAARRPWAKVRAQAKKAAN
jgi:hypothetical protein